MARLGPIIIAGCKVVGNTVMVPVQPALFAPRVPGVGHVIVLVRVPPLQVPTSKQLHCKLLNWHCAGVSEPFGAINVQSVVCPWSVFEVARVSTKPLPHTLGVTSLTL